MTGSFLNRVTPTFENLHLRLSRCTLDPMDSIACVSSATPQVERTHFNGGLSPSFLMVLRKVSWPNNSCQWCRRYWPTSSYAFTTDDVEHWVALGFALVRLLKFHNLVTTMNSQASQKSCDNSRNNWTYVSFLLLCSQFIASDLCSQSHKWPLSSLKMYRPLALRKTPTHPR